MHRDPKQCMFFDLEQDPLEMENLIDKNEHQARIATMREALLQWSMFESRSKTHHDTAAQQCQAENVPEEAGALYPYFKEKMQ